MFNGCSSINDPWICYISKPRKADKLYINDTFAIWDGDEVIPFAKAYSGLTDEAFEGIKHFVQRNNSVDLHRMLELYGQRE